MKIPGESKSNSSQLLLALDCGKPIHWPLEDDYIGGKLLPTLSKGQYRDPRHSVREYVQNGVDGGANRIIIKMTGNSVFIRDDGAGMSSEDLLRARGLGISDKDEDDVGFRGIGIYSSYDLCNRMLITTKKAGSNHAYVLTVDYSGMKKRLDQDKQERRDYAEASLKKPAAKTTAPPKPISLKALIGDFTELTQEPADNSSKNDHYTLVQLEDISKDHMEQLRDTTELKKYVLRNVSVDFADEFPYKDQINQELQRRVKGYRPVSIVLQSDKAKPEVVTRPTIPNLRIPKLDTIYDEKGKAIAFYWACLYEGGGKLPSAEEHGGFVYKVKNFTIGDNRLLHRKFNKAGSGTLYWWYVGEFFVLDNDVVPNTGRDDFEPGPAQKQLDEKVGTALGKLEKDALAFQEESRADKVFSKCAKNLPIIQKKVSLWLSSESLQSADEERIHADDDLNPNTDRTFDPERIYEELGTIIKELKSQKSKTKSKVAVETLIKQAQDLQNLLWANRNGRASSSSQDAQKRAGKQPAAAKKGKGVSSDPTGSSTTQDDINVLEDISLEDLEASGPSEPDQSLIQVFEDAGWEVGESCVEVVQIIDASLSGVLARKAYFSLLNDIQAKLAWRKTGRRV